MLNRIIEFSINNKLIIGILTVFLISYGAFQVTKLPIDAVPDITDNQVQIITIAPSFGATDIERLVTFPIEQANSNIPGIKEIRSFSRFGLSLVTIVFNDATNVYWARQQVAERLQQIQNEIPKGIGTPVLGPVTTGLGEIYQYVVRPKDGYEEKFSETDMRTIQDWIVRRQLLGVKGVAEVSSFGGKLKQYVISVDPNKLQSHSLSINDVFTALEKNNQNTGGAYIEKGSSVLFIRSEGLIQSREDIENIAIKPVLGGLPLLMKDVAEIKIGYATRYGAMCYNDKGEVAGAVVMMLKGANSSEVIKNVKERIKQIQKTLPEGVVIEPFLDRTKMVNNAISTVEKNLIEGALIVVFVLVLFLGNFRAGFLVASVIPLAMLFAVIMMNTFGVSGNLMSLGALDFGLIVDGAVIIVEAVMHQLSHSKKFSHVTRLNQQQMDKEVAFSAGKMMNSAVFGQIIILIVYLPIFTLQGIEGKMFKPMAQTVAFALLGAFLLSLTYIPMMSALFLSKEIKHQPNFSDKVMNKVERIYQSALNKILHIPKLVLSFVITLFVLAIITLSFLGGEFIPALEEGDFAVDTRVLTGSNLTTTIQSTQKVAGILKSRFPEVEKVVTKIGSGEVPTDPMPIEASDMMVILKDKKEWKSAKTFNELAEKMGKAIQDVPGVTASFQYPVQMRFNELMTGARQDVVCKIFGENLDTLAEYAVKMGAIVNSVKGAQNIYIEPVTGIPQVVIEYNRAVIAQYHLNIEDVNRVVNMAFAGQVSGQVFEGEKHFDLIVKLENDKRKNIDDIKNLLIPVNNGTQIPLYQLADVSIKDGPNQIQREDAKRRIVVGFNVRGRDVQSIVNELQQKIDHKMKLPTGYYVTYGGAFENLIAARQRLMIAVPVSLLLIFIILYFAFNSVRQGLLIYSAIPLSIIGGVFFLALRGMPFSISAGVGFIALFGVAVLNGIVLIAEFNRLKAEGWNDLHKIVLMGTKVRLRPVLMTAFVASLGFLPMAISNGAGAEVQRPLATVVIGGLMIATFLTLFVLPILYIFFEKGTVNKPIKSVSSVVLLFALLSSQSLHAQQTITIEQAIDTALKNNSGVRNEQLKAAYKELMIKTNATIPQAEVYTELGQFNSKYFDSKIGINQSFSFPTVYKHQKNLLSEEWKAAQYSVTLKEAELKRLVERVFYTIRYLQEKEKLLVKNDSIYLNFLRLAKLRFDKGESNVLEKTLSESQHGSLLIQLSQIRQEIEVAKLQFQWLLNTDKRYEPSSGNLKIAEEIEFDTTSISNHPELQKIQQEQQLAKAVVKLEKAKLLPDLKVGYYNSSIIGTGADNIYYTASTRFHAAQIGIGVPLFFKSQRSVVKAAQFNEKIAQYNYEQEENKRKNTYEQIYLTYTNNLKTVNYFEREILKNSEVIAETAAKQFASGEINYLEWVMLNNQSVSIQNNYIEAIRELNESVIQLHYLINK